MALTERKHTQQGAEQQHLAQDAEALANAQAFILPETPEGACKSLSSTLFAIIFFKERVERGPCYGLWTAFHQRTA